MNVKLDSKIILKMLAPEDNDHHFWGQMLGGPDLSSFLPQHFKVAATNLLNSDVIAGDVTVDLRGTHFFFFLKNSVPEYIHCHYREHCFRIWLHYL